MTAVEWLQEKYKQQGVIFNLQFEQAKEMNKKKEEQYNDMLSMLRETYRRLEHTDMISLRKQIKETLTFKSE